MRPQPMRTRATRSLEAPRPAGSGGYPPDLRRVQPVKTRRAAARAERMSGHDKVARGRNGRKLGRGRRDLRHHDLGGGLPGDRGRAGEGAGSARWTRRTRHKRHDAHRGRVADPNRPARAAPQAPVSAIGGSVESAIPVSRRPGSARSGTGLRAGVVPRTSPASSPVVVKNMAPETFARSSWRESAA